MNSLIKNKSNLYEILFRIGLKWKIFYGFLRLILGFILFNFIGTPLADIFYKIMSHEIIEDPNDLLIQTFNPLLQHFSLNITYFLAFYIIFWGVIDIFISINLLKEKIWAFPISIYLISIFILYEISRFFYTHSFILLFVIIIDIILIWII
ncbi:DUF2127 domain-containing protein, partial [Patescibacteria group bacterium]|nr:DUF2127 domain-containing protein [Patescibacteria group bacterium]